MYLIRQSNASSTSAHRVYRSQLCVGAKQEHSGILHLLTSLMGYNFLDGDCVYLCALLCFLG